MMQECYLTFLLTELAVGSSHGVHVDLQQHAQACGMQNVVPQSSCWGALLQHRMVFGAPVQDCYLTFFLTELAGATAMVFTRTCDNTRKLALMLRNLGFDALPIHGQMSQPKRLGALNKFKGGDRNILVATGEVISCLPFPKAVHCHVQHGHSPVFLQEICGPNFARVCCDWISARPCS